VSLDLKAEQKGLRQRLRWLMAFRFIFSAVLILAILFVPGGKGNLFGSVVRSVLILAFVHFAASVGFFLLHKFATFVRLNVQAYSQIGWDLLFTTAFVSITGGLDSDIKQLYWLTIAFAAILLFRFGAFLAACLSSLLYAALLNLELLKLVSPLLHVQVQTEIWQEDRIIRSIILHTAGFFLVAYVMGWAASKLRQAEAMLEEKSADLEDLEAMMGRIVDSLTSGLATMDLNGKILFWSRAAEEITGLAGTVARGRRFIDIFPDAKEKLELRPDQLAAEGRPWRWEMEYREKQGETKTLGFSSTPLKHGKDSQSGILVIFQDLTNYREMEEKVKRADRLAAVGELAARIAHEIRNPLTSVSGSIEVLKNNPKLSDRDQRLMGIVVRETDRLNQLLTDFLSFARPPVPQFEEVSLDRLLRETSELFSKSHGIENLNVILNLDDRVVIKGDSRQLNQMFWNLIKNASEAMPNGGNIRVVLASEPRDGIVRIEVHDEGMGIPKAVRDRIFIPFFTTKAKGTGLGLAMVRRIAEEHAGEVVVETEEGKGTVIRVILPTSAQAASASQVM
jgi:two-component system, NtrC family, sensor histidine kinase PilS